MLGNMLSGYDDLRPAMFPRADDSSLVVPTPEAFLSLSVPDVSGLHH